MLDAIADFWKPVKKNQPQEKLHTERLQVGSVIGFGFVPQAILSGRRLKVTAINSYQFGDETLTSFVLSQFNESDVSMIVAEAEGEQYLAISRKMSVSDRVRLCDNNEIEAIINKADLTKFTCREGVPEKGWTVGNYTREIQGMKGRLFKGDFRKIPLAAASDPQNFEYTLLVSESNEHAIEIEKYNDGRVEIYATIYRRMNDVGEIIYTPEEAARNDFKPAPRPEVKPALVSGAAPVVAETPKPAVMLDTKASFPPVAPKPAFATLPTPPKPEPIKLQDFPKTEEKFEVRSEFKPEIKPEAAPEIKTETAPQAKAEEPEAKKAAPQENPTEKPTMQNTESAFNGTRSDMNGASEDRAKLYVQPTAPESYLKQEIKTVSKAPNGMDNEAIECELRVANKIIDEAIRNEMRLSDIVRRIIELPVAYPEAVQIPITLSDEDYALLAIRYSMSSSDRNSIKRKIIEDLNDFSGGKKQQAKAA